MGTLPQKGNPEGGDYRLLFATPINHVAGPQSKRWPDMY